MLGQDVKQAIRALAARQAFAAAAILTLAVGIGANITVFSIVNALLLRPLPFGERSDRVVTLHSTHRLQPEDYGWGDSELSYADLVDYRAARTLEGIGGYLARNFTLGGDQGAERVAGGSVTPDLFDLLGVAPILGRTFLPEDAAPPGLESSVLLTHGLWQRRFGADPAIVGRAILINEMARTVVGVLPPGFKFPERDELYLPLRLDDAPREARGVNAVALLREGVSLAEAQGELDAIAARLERDYPDTNRGWGVRVMLFRDSQVDAEPRALAVTLMAAVAFVLLIACANLANLQLVRGAARQREMAVRAALGARRAQLMSGLIVEVSLVALAGAGLGLLGSQWAIDFIQRSFPEELPFWLRFDVDVRVAVFAVAAAAVTTAIAGVLPALRASRPDLVRDLNAAGRGVSLGRAAQRLQGGLVVAQVALCLALLVGANLMIRSFLAMQDADLGFDHRPVLSARAYLAGDAYDAVPARAAFFQQLAAELGALPGVTAAAATTSIPGDDGGFAVRLAIEGRTGADEALAAISVGVTPGIFDALGVSLEAGRAFSASETTDPSAAVVIVNRALADRLWPGDSAVDRRLGVWSGGRLVWHRVVGVAPDVHYEEPGEATEQSQLTVYVPYAQLPARTMALLLRAAGPPALLAAPARDTVRRLHAGLPLFEVMPMTERRRFTTWEQEFFGEMMGVFAAIALLLAAVGVYALLHYAARRRLVEVGVRLAMGAAPRDVVRLFVVQGARVGALGLVIGLALAAALAAGLRGFLWGVEAFDGRLFAGMGLVLLGVVILASYLPARRAAHLDPMIALRTE
ncbi:MAG: ABC transporter permease [Acidobacteriota bacterium]